MKSNRLNDGLKARAEKNDKIVGEILKGLITYDQWLMVTTPFHYVRIKNKGEYSKWTETEFDMAAKYISANAISWVYHKDGLFAFGSEADWTLFKLWIHPNIFDENSGSVS